MGGSGVSWTTTIDLLPTPGDPALLRRVAQDGVDVSAAFGGWVRLTPTVPAATLERALDAALLAVQHARPRSATVDVTRTSELPQHRPH